MRSLETARRAYVDAVLSTAKVAPAPSAPLPSSHPDPRMNLTLTDVALKDSRFKDAPPALEPTKA